MKQNDWSRTLISANPVACCFSFWSCSESIPLPDSAAHTTQVDSAASLQEWSSESDREETEAGGSGPAEQLPRWVSRPGPADPRVSIYGVSKTLDQSSYCNTGLVTRPVLVCRTALHNAQQHQQKQEKIKTYKEALDVQAGRALSRWSSTFGTLQIGLCKSSVQQLGMLNNKPNPSWKKE